MKRAIIIGLVVVSAVAWGAAAVVVAGPVANFAVSTGGKPYTVLFDASASTDAASTITAYQWTFGDGYTGVGKRVAHTYANAGSYVVTLVVFDAAYAVGRMQRTVIITADGTLQSPLKPKFTRANVPVGLKVGDAAPEFALADSTGKVHKLSDFLGKVVILEFWRSTCPHCQESMPHLKALYDRYKKDGVVVVLVALDYNMATAQAYLTAHGYTDFINLWDDPRRGDKTVADLYNVGSIPHTLLIDRHGVIRYTGWPGQLLDSDIGPWL